MVSAAQDYEDDFNDYDMWGHEISKDIQKVWREHGPEDERLCDWTRTFVEPWASIAKAIGVQ